MRVSELIEELQRQDPTNYVYDQDSRGVGRVARRTIDRQSGANGVQLESFSQTNRPVSE